MTLVRAVTVKWLRQKTDGRDSSVTRCEEIGNGKYTQNFNEFCCKKEPRNEEQEDL